MLCLHVKIVQVQDVYQPKKILTANYWNGKLYEALVRALKGPLERRKAETADNDGSSLDCN